MNLIIENKQPEWVNEMERYAKTQNMADQSRRLVSSAAETYKMDGILALFSGGHDSLAATHVAARHPLFKSVVHIDTGTGLPETRRFVEETCKREGWPLIIKSPAITYEMLILKYGFPGPNSHRFMYRYLKERPLMEAKKEANKLYGTKRLGLTGGMRAQESVRRMGNVEPMHKDGQGYWVSVIHNWTAIDVNQYITARKLPRNPVKDTMHLSGECFCGSFARKEEKRELAMWYPEHAAKIEAWQKLVQTAIDLGLSSIPFNYQQWGHGANGSGRGITAVPDAQMELIPMCWFCRGEDVA